MRIANPCSADWSAMPGDEVTRSCASCGKQITDVDAMDEAAFATLRRGGGGACVRGTVDGEGRLVRALVLAGATAAVVAGGGGSVAWGPAPDRDTPAVTAPSTDVAGVASEAEEIERLRRATPHGDEGPTPPAVPPAAGDATISQGLFLMGYLG
jgi:hypothetical protein